MKFIAFFAFLATISATTVKFSPDVECEGLEESYPYDKCGVNPISFNGRKAAALITDNKMGVVFYEKVDCTGEEYYEVRGPVPGKKCYNLEQLLYYEPLCIKIVC